MLVCCLRRSWFILGLGQGDCAWEFLSLHFVVAMLQLTGFFAALQAVYRDYSLESLTVEMLLPVKLVFPC